MEELIPAEITGGMVEPKSTSSTQIDWFVASELDKPEVLKANACDLAFFLVHNDSDKRIGLTHFNQKHSTVDPEVTTIQYCPITST